MICSKCGQEFDDGVKFCTNCGAELSEQEAPETTVPETVDAVEETTVPAETSVEEVTPENEVVVENVKEDEKKGKPEKGDSGKKMSGIVKIGAALAGAVILILIIVALCSGKKEYVELSKKSVVQVVNNNDVICARLANGEMIVLDNDSISSTCFSLDRTTVSFMNSDDELAILSDGKLKTTGIDDVRNVKISNEGNTLIYYSDYEAASYQNAYGYYDSIGVGTLHLYYVKSGKDIEIADDVVIGSAVLSPNGETVAYVSDYDAPDDFKGYYSVNGKKPVEFGKEKRIFAIADKGAYVYYADDDRIYVQKKKKDAEKLASDMRGTDVFLNADCTEMLYTSDGKTYVTQKAGEKKKVSGERLSSILLNNTAVVAQDSISAEQGQITVTYTGVDTFKEKLFYSSGAVEILYIKDDFETEKVASRAWEYAVADSGESLVYISGDDIVKVTGFAKGGVRTELSDDAEVCELYADGDLKYIYYVNDDEELYCISGKKAKKIADDVTSVTVSADGERCYYVVDNEKLCYSKKAGKGKEIYSGDDVKITCSSNYGFDYVRVRDGEDVEIFLMDGKNMKSIYAYED